MVQFLSLGLVIYVFVTNHRVHMHWSHLRNADEMLPIRVALRRNMDVAGALIASNLLNAVCFLFIGADSAIVYALHAPLIPPVKLVRLPTSLLCMIYQTISGCLLRFISAHFHQLRHDVLSVDYH